MKYISCINKYKTCIEPGLQPDNPPQPPFFCKLVLNDGSIVELEGSGELTQAMVSDQYKNSLVSAEIGELCTSIEQGAFMYCTSLASVTIPNSVTSIGYIAFVSCTGLTSVTIPNSVTSIGEAAFNNCTSLLSVTIPSSVTSISGGAFGSCTAIRELFYNAQCEINTSFRGWGNALEKVVIGDLTPSIGKQVFASCSNLSEVHLGNSITSIGQNAFASCTSLTNVIIPDSVITIGSSAFQGANLTSIIIPNNVTSIGASAFQQCYNLTSAVIGESVAEINNYAFSNCDNLESITILATTPPNIGNDIFYYRSSIYVPAESVETYKTASGWSTYASRIQAIP